MKISRYSCVVLLLLAALCLTYRALRPPTPAWPNNKAKPQIAQQFGKLPMLFQANAGQTDEQVKFVARGAGYALFLTPRESVFVLSQKSARAVLRMKLVGANPESLLAGVDELPTKVNYFSGKDPSQWHADIATYSGVRYTQVYPGVDMVYHGNQRKVEYDFVIAPGADASQISLAFSEAEKVEVEESSGDLLLHTAIGVLRQHKPIAYQEVNGTRHFVQSSYVKRGDGKLSFEVAAYDGSRELVIDPTLSYSTFVGGTGAAQGDNIGGDQSNAIAADADGNVYVVGSTDSADFPVTPGAYNTTYPGSGKTIAFIFKMNPSGNALVYCSFLSASSVVAVAVDASGNAYLTGGATAGFPTTSGAYQTTYASSGSSGSNAFITKLNPAGNALVYSTYIGGTGNPNFNGFTGGEIGSGIAIDSAGNAYITGATYSHDYPITAGAFQTTNKANNVVNPKTAFVTKLNSTGTALLYSTYLGGTDLDNGVGIAVDASNNAYVVGTAASSDFPTTAGSVHPTFPGFRAAFVTKLNTTGTGLVYSTYSGGSAFAGTQGQAIAVDGSGNAYITGQTMSTNYPTTPGSFRSTYCGGFSDAYVSKINATGSAYGYSTYLCGVNLAGGDNAEYGFGIAVDAAGSAYVTGYTDSDTFPVTADAYQTTRQGFDDAFLTKLSVDGATLVYSTFFGGSGFDGAYGGIALDGSSHAYIAGGTASSTFPTTPGAFQTTYAGGNDVFVAKFNFNAPTVGHLLNISTRAHVMGGAEIAIGGFILSGNQSHQVVIRGIGPSLPGYVANRLSDPVLNLFDSSSSNPIATNNDWKSNQQMAIEATGLAPGNDLDAAILTTLAPGAYTAQLSGTGNATGTGLVEVYDLGAVQSGGPNLAASASEISNISTRAMVETGDNVMIGGLIVGNGETTAVVVDARGQSLPSSIANRLADPVLSLYDENGHQVASNDDWQQDSAHASIPSSLSSSYNSADSAVYRVLVPGNYTAVVRGKNNNTGVALVEIYHVD